MGPIGMAGLQAGAKAVDGLVDIGVNSLNEALWGDYYRDKEVEQSQRLLDQQTAAQSKLMKQSKDQQLAMWNETNYGAQTAHLQAKNIKREPKQKQSQKQSQKQGQKQKQRPNDNTLIINLISTNAQLSNNNK